MSASPIPPPSPDGNCAHHLRAVARAVLTDGATCSDHLLVFADALRALARENRLAGCDTTAAEIDTISHQVTTVAPLYA